MKNIQNIEKLGKYLISNGVESPLKLQKMLFFFRYEEIKNKKNSGYFKDNFNFEAWVYGPVNPESYEIFKLYFWNLDEKQNCILDKKEIEEMDVIFLDFFKKYNIFSAHELVDKSHLNIEWNNLRKGLKESEPSKEKLNEKHKEFIQFNQ